MICAPCSQNDGIAVTALYQVGTQGYCRKHYDLAVKNMATFIGQCKAKGMRQAMGQGSNMGSRNGGRKRSFRDKTLIAKIQDIHVSDFQTAEKSDIRPLRSRRGL